MWPLLGTNGESLLLYKTDLKILSNKNHLYVTDELLHYYLYHGNYHAGKGNLYIETELLWCFVIGYKSCMIDYWLSITVIALQIGQPREPSKSSHIV